MSRIENYKLPDNNYKIIVTGWNCAKYVIPCINSVLNQTIDTWEMFIASDNSTDETNEILKTVNDPRIKIFLHTENKGAACRRWELMNMVANPESVIVLLDLDDELLPLALETVEPYYKQGKLMTYGNYITQYGKVCEVNLDYSDDIWKDRSFRNDPIWRCTHLKTFKRKLLDEIYADDFKIDGNWIDATTESPLGFALLELCGRDRVGIIKQPIYKYNVDIYKDYDIKTFHYKHKIYDKIRKLTKYALYEGS